MERAFERKLAAIFYADVDGYSRMMGADEDGTHLALSKYLDFLTDTVVRNDGRVVHFAGDAVLAEFASVVAALKAALMVQRELRARNDPIPERRRLQFRIGVNLGEVIVDRNDIFGDGVNVAARLETLADAGGIAVSRQIYEHARNKIGCAFDDMGEHRVKNIAEPVHVYRVRIDPADKPARRKPATAVAAWRGAALATAIILVLQAASFGIWDTFIRSRPAEPAVPRPTPESEARLAVEKLAATMAPGSVFRHCADCPELVVVPPGVFLMGSPDAEAGRQKNEGPQHSVRFARPFAIGRYEVTLAQWDACVTKKGCDHRPQDRGWGRGNRPAIYVNWHDAQQYVRWLSELTSHRYRLPSEAEWEYAARAGSQTAYAWGADIGADLANCKGCAIRDAELTLPVGSFAANRFGLHDVHGNVWEWTADCWNGSYAGAPEDGSEWTTGDCGRRVLKGGAWGHEPPDLRAAHRLSDTPDLRSGRRGFRVVMMLP